MDAELDDISARAPATVHHVSYRLDLAEARRMYDCHGWIPLVFRTVGGMPSREFLIEKTDDEIELSASCAGRTWSTRNGYRAKWRRRNADVVRRRKGPDGA
jgi:hypothetical protein